MTFGEKLFQLRKATGLSQEELADKLNTSRQAVSKWENNNGYPETEKIIMISKVFQVNLNDLLLDEQEVGSDKARNTHKDIGETKGFYVNRETVNGFLFYYKRKFLLLAAVCGIILGCNAVSFTFSEPTFFTSRVEPVLATVSIMLALSVVVFIVLKQNPYRMLRKKELVFAEDVRKELKDEFLRMNKILTVGIVVGLIIFGVTNSGYGMENIGEMAYEDIILRTVVSMILTGISSFIAFFCIGIYWSYSILLRNSEREE